MRPRIKSIDMNGAIAPVQSVTIKGLFTTRVKAVRVTTSGTKEQIEAKFAKRARASRRESEKHLEELAQMVKENGIKTKYFAA